MPVKYSTSPGPQEPAKKPEKDVEKQKERQRKPEIDVGRNSGKKEKPNRINPNTLK